MNAEQLSSSTLARYIAWRGDVVLDDLIVEETAFRQRLTAAQEAEREKQHQAEINAAFAKAHPWLLAVYVACVAVLCYVFTIGAV